MSNPYVYTRPVEMAICWGDGSWNAEHFVDIPQNTPDDKVEAVAREVLLKELEGKPSDHLGVAGIWLYNSSESEDDETEIPERLTLSVLMEIDDLRGRNMMSPSLSRTEIANAFLDELSILLQREPYGWGATVTAKIQEGAVGVVVADRIDTVNM